MAKLLPKSIYYKINIIAKYNKINDNKFEGEKLQEKGKMQTNLSPVIVCVYHTCCMK